MPSIYFDNNATTPIDPRVREAMVEALDGDHANPSSSHAPGRTARDMVDRARAQVAEMLGADPQEVVFTASGSESNIQVIRGVAERCGRRGHLIYSTLEHVSVRRACLDEVDRGMEATEVPPDADGVVTPEAVAAALREDTRLVCLMQANNELGTIQPVAEIAALCAERGVEVLCDAVQAVGKIPVRVKDLGVDYLTLGGHKFHGPLGCAALWIRRGRSLQSLVVGASQEGGRRAGTENVPGIVALGKACKIAHDELAERHERLLALREALEDGLREIPDAVVHCTQTPRLPHTSHVAFLGASGFELMHALDRAGFAVSTGSACSSGAPEPSAALTAMGVDEAEALASLRISFGLTNRAEEIDAFLPVLARELEALREPALVAGD